MLKKYRERLLTLAKYMENVKPAKFDISTWYADTVVMEGLPSTKKDNRKIALVEGFCNSPACVLGHAALIPEFQKKGLYVDITGDYLQTYRPGVVYISADFEAQVGIEAGQAFFNLSSEHAEVLFFYGDSECYSAQFYLNDPNATHNDFGKIKPKHVATALYKYIATDGKVVDDVLAEIWN